MSELVPYGVLFAILAGFVIAGMSWCTWYVRKRVRRMGRALTAQVDERISAMADAMAARVDAKLDAAARDIALATARVNAAVEHVERLETSWQASSERISLELSSLRQDLHSRRYPVEQHPQTVAELERIYDRLRAVDHKIDRMAANYQEAVLAAALRFTRPGSA